MYDEKVEIYVSKQKQPQKEICQLLRSLIHEALPDVKEEMKWGVPTFDEGNFYIVALKEHVNIGFLLEKLSAEETSLLEGSGKTMKNIGIASTQDVDKKRIVKLLKLIHSKSKKT